MTADELISTLEENESTVIDGIPYCVIDPDDRTIAVPESEKFFGVTNDKDVERRYFICPKVVGDNIDLSQHQIYVAYAYASNETTIPKISDGLYNCEDVEVSGDNITFSWKLSDNVFANAGFIVFKVMAKKMDGNILKTKWNTLPAYGTVLMTLPDGTQIESQYPDILTQILDRLDILEQGSGSGSVDPEQIKQAVNGYLEENPVSGMTAEQEQQLNQNTTDVAGLKSALEQKGLPAGGTLGQVLVKKSDENYDVEWKNVSAGTSDQYFEMVSSGSSTTNGVSLDISGILSNPPTSGEWDGLQNWYQMSYRADAIPAQNGLPVEKLISKPIKGIPYFRAFTDSGSRYATSNAIAFYGCNSDKAIEEEGNQCSLCEKKFVYTPVDQLPNGTSDAGVIVTYPQEKFDYYYIKLDTAFYSSSNAGKYNRLNPTYISAFDSSVLDNPLIEIGTNTEEFLRMKDEYLDGYYKNMFSHDKFKEIFKNYYAQMAPKIGVYQTCGKAIYIGGDSLHAYAGGDGISTAGFMTNWNQYLGFSVVTNAGYAGSTWSELTGGGGLKRAKDLISAGTVYDVIILAWGTNDDTGGNGAIEDEASDSEGCTMVAAMKWIITNLRNTFKNTAIGVIIPPPKGTEDGMKTRGDLMIQVCELLHVPYVDMREYISISDLGSDTVHLGTGAGKYGAAEASLILRICQYGDTLYPGTTD